MEEGEMEIRETGVKCVRKCCRSPIIQRFKGTWNPGWPISEGDGHVKPVLDATYCSNKKCCTMYAFLPEAN